MARIVIIFHVIWKNFQIQKLLLCKYTVEHKWIFISLPVYNLVWTLKYYGFVQTQP